jgi:rhomboid family GlyGly-CTERM serine protease
MGPPDFGRWCWRRRWTLGLFAVMALLNAHLFVPMPAAIPDATTWLAYDRDAVLNGEVWRLVTGCFVHGTPAHFIWDLSTFLLLGLLYEPDFPRSYPILIASSVVALGLVVFLFLPSVTRSAGWSGVDYSVIVAALWVEAGRARRRGLVNALAVAGAALIAGVNVVHELVTGRMVFNAESLGGGDIQLLWVAHPTGTLVALVFLVVRHEALKGDTALPPAGPGGRAELKGERA